MKVAFVSLSNQVVHFWKITSHRELEFVQGQKIKSPIKSVLINGLTRCATSQIALSRLQKSAELCVSIKAKIGHAKN